MNNQRAVKQECDYIQFQLNNFSEVRSFLEGIKQN